MRQGWWATHKYHRRKCASEGGDFMGWMGWYPPKKYPEKMAFVPLINSLDGDQRNLLLSLFFCGSRANEILLAKRKNFEIKDECVDANLPVFKKLRGKRFEDGEWKWRHPTINRKEPLCEAWVQFLEGLGKQDRLFKFGYKNLYHLVVNVKWRGKNADLFPHVLRAHRASQLVEQYNVETHLLKAFFEWSRDETPNFYVKLGRRGWKNVYGIEKETDSVGLKAAPFTTEARSKTEADLINSTLKAQKEGEIARVTLASTKVRMPKSPHPPHGVPATRILINNNKDMSLRERLKKLEKELEGGDNE